MNEYQVTCINKPHRMSPHEHITHIGNVTNICSGLHLKSVRTAFDANSGQN